MNDIEPILLKILIIVAAAVGLAVASYIRVKKSKKQTLICPLNSNCNAVVNSKYSRFLGLPVETMGIVYYALFTLLYLVVLFSPAFTDVTELALGFLSACAAAFSIYLVGLQAIVIKEWCFWCLCSAVSSVTIFVFFVLI